MLCTFRFVEDVIFAHNRPSKGELKLIRRVIKSTCQKTASGRNLFSTIALLNFGGSGLGLGLGL